jgi:hypothetical protein
MQNLLPFQNRKFSFARTKLGGANIGFDSSDVSTTSKRRNFDLFKLLYKSFCGSNLFVTILSQGVNVSQSLLP